MIKHDENFEKGKKKDNKKKHDMKFIKQHIKNLSMRASFMDKEIMGIDQKLDKILLRLNIINDGGKWKEGWEEEIDEEDILARLSDVEYEVSRLIDILEKLCSEENDVNSEEDVTSLMDSTDKADSTMEVLDNFPDDSQSNPADLSNDTKKSKMPQTKQIRNIFIRNFINCSSNDISEKIVNKRFERTLNQVKDKNSQSKLHDDLILKIKDMIVSIVNGTEKYKHSNDEIDSLINNEFEKYWEYTLKPLIKSYTKLRNNQKRDFMKEKSTIKNELVSREIININ